MLAAFLIWRFSRPMARRVRALLMAGAALLAVTVASSRVWLGVHYTTDVLSGFLLGSLWAGLAVAIDEGLIAWPNAGPDTTPGPRPG